MIKQETQHIAGRETTSVQFTAMRATGLAVRLLKLVGPSIAHLVSADVKTVEDFMKKDVDLGLIVADLFNAADERTVSELVRDLLANTTVVHNGALVELSSEKAIDVVFSGELGALLSTVKFAIRLNYADFFAGASAKPG